uniref:Uncharacterized protein n=1 Tax=Anopheles melas TaxID=34690 RepID=A0A182TTS8_9DIPT
MLPQSPGLLIASYTTTETNPPAGPSVRDVPFSVSLSPMGDSGTNDTLPAISLIMGQNPTMCRLKAECLPVFAAKAVSQQPSSSSVNNIHHCLHVWLALLIIIIIILTASTPLRILINAV